MYKTLIALSCFLVIMKNSQAATHSKEDFGSAVVDTFNKCFDKGSSPMNTPDSMAGAVFIPTAPSTTVACGMYSLFGGTSRYLNNELKQTIIAASPDAKDFFATQGASGITPILRRAFDLVRESDSQSDIDLANKVIELSLETQ